MNITHSTISVLAIIAISLGISLMSSCSNSKRKDADVKAQESKKEKVSKQVSITKQQFDAIKIEFGTIEQKNLHDNLKSTGFLKVPPQNKANVTSALGGTVEAILVQEGDKVSKGQTIVTLTNPEFIKMQEEFLVARSQLTFAEAEYYRQRELSSKNVVAQKTFQQAESEYNSLKAKFNSLKRQLAILNINTAQLTDNNISSFINVVSPINGNISNIEINIGSNVEASKILMNVVDNSRLHLDLSVFEQELPKVKLGQNIDFALTNLPGRNFTARIFSIGTAFEIQTKTITVHAEITGNKMGLIEGMNVIGYINVESLPVLAVLSTAIVSSSGSDYIFVQINRVKQKNEKSELYSFEKVQVKKGVTDGNYTEITPLLPIQDKANIVINGSFYLMAILTNEGEE